MLVLVFFIATVNLAVGYALGARMGLPARLSFKLPKLRRVATEPTSAAPQPAAAPEPAPVARKVAAAVAAPQPAAPAAKSADKANMLAGLAAMREKLGSVSLDLHESIDSPEEFDACATKLQEANHEYLERAQETIERLGELGAEGDRRAEEAAEAVSAGCGEVAALSTKVDELLTGELDDAKRAALLTSADAIVESAERVADATAAQAGIDPKFDSIDLLFDRLETLLESALDERPTLLAAIELDPLDEAGGDDVLVATIRQEVASLIAEIAPGAPTFGGGARCLVLLQGDDIDAATERVERMRQTMAATTFRQGDGAVQATVTCTLAEVSGGVGRGAIESQFAQVMIEADQGGRNRTYHHDGAFPTLVPAAELRVAPRFVTV
jgi:hypothetical protein